MAAHKIFIVHGWTYTLAKWDGVVEELTKLGYEPVLLKVPGLTQPSDDEWDIPKYVAWLDQQLKGEDEPIVVGHSNGGRIALAYDVAHPKRLKHIFLISSAGVYHQKPAITVKRKVAKSAAKALKPVVRGKARRVAYRLIGASDYGNAKPNMQKTMTNVINFDAGLDLSQVQTPITFIWGEKDTITPIEDACVMMEKVQRPEELHTFEDSGHSSQGDHPGEVAEIINVTLQDM